MRKTRTRAIIPQEIEQRAKHKVFQKGKGELFVPLKFGEPQKLEEFSVAFAKLLRDA